MSRERTTLRDFGGGIDLSVVDDEELEEVHARTQLVKTGGDRTITDLGVRLEADLLERREPRLLATAEDTGGDGDTERYRLRLEPVNADWTDGLYLRATPTAANRRFDRAVMQYDGYPTVGLPRAWLRNETVKDVTNPFHAAEAGDHVVVRYLPRETIEIYPEAVFNAHPRFVRLRAVMPFIVVTADESTEDIPYYDLAADTPYDGQLFEIVPFDLKEFFDHVCRIHDVSDPDVEQYLRPDPFTEIVESTELTPYTADEITIYWGEETVTPFNEELVTLEDVRRFRAAFPKNGLVHLDSVMPGAPWAVLEYDNAADHVVEGWDTEFALSQVTEEWWGRFAVPTDGPPCAYVPVKSSEFYNTYLIDPEKT